MITNKTHITFLRYILALFVLLILGTIGASSQQLYSYNNLDDGGYNFWFYSPEAPPPTIVPMLPSDTEYQKRLILEHDFHLKAHDWLHWKAKKEEERKKELKPLVIFLHGASLCGHNLKQVLKYGTLDAMNRGLQLEAFVLAPQNPGGAWNPTKLMNIVEWASRTNQNLDTTRIYVIGMSLGGYGALDLPAAYPQRIAASVSICGGATTKDIQNLNEVPLWIFHGTADVAVPISCSDRVVAAMKRKTSPTRLIYSRLIGYNHSQPARLFYMNEVYEWLFSHSLTDEKRPLNKEIYIGPRNIPMAYGRMQRRGHLISLGQREVYAHSHKDAIEFTHHQDSIAKADSLKHLLR